MSGTSTFEVEFTKMDGLGNDFIVIDSRSFSRKKQERLLKHLVNRARSLSDRRRGVGFDQILLIRSAVQKNSTRNGATRIALSIVDADGSIAEMCGNGVRAVHVLLNKKKLEIETLAGLIETESLGPERVRVKMGVPKIVDRHQPFVVKVLGRKFAGVRVDMGNPHFVMFRSGAEDELERYGPLLERHRAFRHGTNVEWVKVLSRNSVQVDVWERGSGKTLACGTGACASYVAAVALGKIRSGTGRVRMPGGPLRIEWKDHGDAVLMTGPAKIRFKGRIEI